MKKLFFCCLFLSACHPSNSQTSANSAVTADLATIAKTKANSGIVGGNVASNTDPLQLEVFEYRTYVPKDVTAKTKSTKTDSPYDAWECTTSAVSPRIFMLAAHCIDPTAVKSEVLFVQPDGSIIPVPVKASIVNKDYNDNNDAPDLALILLEKDAPGNIHIMTLPSTTQPLIFNQIRAAGFGFTTGVDEDHNHDADVLRYTTLEVADFKLDQPSFIIDQSHGRGICQGDSGSSAVVAVNGTYYSVGVASETITSEDNPKDECDEQSQFVNVQYYHQWLSDNIAALQKQIQQ